MANVFQSGSIYVDATGALSTKKLKVAYIIYTSSAAADSLVLKDGGSSGVLKINIKNPTANNTMILDFSAKPLIFQDGIYVSTLTASSLATLILTSGEDS